MKSVLFNVTTETAVAVQSSPGVEGEVNRTLDHLPGSALRGAFASKYLKANGDTDSRFRELFLEGDVLFTDAYPDYAFPVVQSLHTCKMYPGFRSAEEAHGCVDLLVDYLLFKLSDRKQLPAARSCSSCQSDLVRLRSGFFQRVRDTGVYLHCDVRHGLTMRTAIQNLLETAQHEALYGHDVIAEEQQFSFCVLVPDTKQDLVELLLHETEATWHVGASRTRDLGWVRIEAVSEDDFRFPPLADRLNGFDNYIQRVGKERLATDWKYDDDLFFTLDCYSDCALLDSYLRPVDSLAVQSLGYWGDCIFSQASLELSLQTHRQRFGWNQCLQMPKQPLGVIQMGSVFCYRISKSSRGDLETALARIEEAGIGLRTCEGLGRVLASHPVHWEEYAPL